MSLLERLRKEGSGKQIMSHKTQIIRKKTTCVNNRIINEKKTFIISVGNIIIAGYQSDNVIMIDEY